MRYYRDHDDENLIVRVWTDAKNSRKGEYWYIGKSDKWHEADKLAWIVADEIYENHPLSDAEVEMIIGEKVGEFQGSAAVSAHPCTDSI